MSKDTTKNNTETTQQNGKILSGVVVSDKMQDTIVVKVTRYTKHPKYGKFLNSAKKYQVHDAGNTAKIDDKVTIAEVKPISKNKRFTLIEIIK
jgi:small subunit ribosomal protein S17